MSKYSSASITVDDSDPRDPAARCNRCGKQGTVARAVRHSEPPETLRYCSTCWPDAQYALEQRQPYADRGCRLPRKESSTPQLSRAVCLAREAQFVLNSELPEMVVSVSIAKHSPLIRRQIAECRMLGPGDFCTGLSFECV
jgi:hypothetical protein